MPRKLLRHILPAAAQVRRDRNLRRLFGTLLHNDNLWHLNRFSVAWAVSVGLFMAFVPVPGQMLLAAGAAIVVGCNLPIAIVIVWISNPITLAPMFFAAYKFGAWLLDVPPGNLEFEMSFNWLLHELGGVWQPFLLGCFLLGLICAAIGHVVVRIIWRIHVVYAWRERRARRRDRMLGSTRR